MRALLQRVKQASVSVDGVLHTAIDRGLLIFVGVKSKDALEDAQYLARRCAHLRIFEDVQGKMNLSVKDISGSVLIVSQFTLYADTRKGTRPGFSDAAPPESAEPLYNNYVDCVRSELGDSKVVTGVFRAMMEVSLINDGPVTVIIESKEASL